MEDLTCSTCNRTFVQKQHLTRHIKNSHEEGTQTKCNNCDRKFNRLENLRRHQKHCNAQQTSSVAIVGKKRKRSKKKTTLTTLVKKSYNLIKSKSALNGAVEMWKIKFTNSDRDTNFADEIQDAVNRTIEKLQQSRKKITL